MRRVGEGDIRKFSVTVENRPVLIVKSVEKDAITDKLNDRYFEGPILSMAMSVQTLPDGKFGSAHLYNRRTGEGLLEIPQEAHYLEIKKAIEEAQAKLAKEARTR